MKHLIIDTDPGVDDAIALLLIAAASGQDAQWQLDGVTTVGGNVSLDQVTRNAFTVLELAGRPDVKVYRGAPGSSSEGRATAHTVHGDDGLGNAGYTPSGMNTPHEASAVEFLTSHVAAHPGEVTILALGPLTNIAAAVRADPTFAANTQALVLMGGAEGAGNMTPSAEFNFWSDPRAAKATFEAGFPDLVMVGLDATRQAHLTPGLRELIRQFDTPISRFIHAITRSCVDDAYAEHGHLGTDLHDPLAAAYLLAPDLIRTVPAHVQISADGPDEGRSVVARSTGGLPWVPANAAVAESVDTAGFFTLLLTTLFPDHAERIARAVAHETR